MSHAENAASTITLPVPGDLVSTNASAVRAAAEALLDSHSAEPGAWSTLNLDLSKARMVDSVGLNLIVSLFKLAQKRGAGLQITYSNPSVLRTLTFTRLDKYMRVEKA